MCHTVAFQSSPLSLDAVVPALQLWRTVSQVLPVPLPLFLLLLPRLILRLLLLWQCTSIRILAETYIEKRNGGGGHVI